MRSARRALGLPVLTAALAAAVGAGCSASTSTSGGGGPYQMIAASPQTVMVCDTRTGQVWVANTAAMTPESTWRSLGTPPAEK